MNTIQTGKGAVDADVLIDDRDQNVIDFASRKECKGVLMSQPWNKDTVRLEPLIRERRVFVANDWRDVRVLFGLSSSGAPPVPSRVPAP